VKTKDRRKLEKKVLALWSKVVRLKGYCEICGPKVHHDVLHAHHIYSCRHQGTRYKLENGCCLCPAHHIYFAHRDIMEFSDWVQANRPKELLDRLRIWARTTSHLTQFDLEFLEDEFNKRLTALQENTNVI